ncbi:class I SAM-dependent methyltransferase [Ketobacter sp. MCCC 1A13808]|uniref:class I SAM-dependent methyltransferase n=1 Tax=Ketobacter sp. MCCC 1A13808 TaxID=2602738 RepID=UPI0012EB260D|nr:class I SAM-dependent methyltransferase [Ketobacter sp. MCCC 1A13808]MVF11178.1 class I SAM-dependent methyltransferase [Ketobacter sp. MCCC 1A13808]
MDLRFIAETLSVKNLTKKARGLMRYPIHPQWFTRKEASLLRSLREIGENKTVLDIGCADKWIIEHLPATTNYIGLDYPSTADRLYGTKPTVYGSASALPFENESFDRVVLLDVLEHLKEPAKSLSEIHRTLAYNGTLLLRVPFLYPIHDSPHDYSRLTEYGLTSLTESAGFKLVNLYAIGAPLETTALLRNMAISVLILHLIKNRNPFAIFGILLPIYFLLNNLYSYFLSRLVKAGTALPHTYLVTAIKIKDE